MENCRGLISKVCDIVLRQGGVSKADLWEFLLEEDPSSFAGISIQKFITYLTDNYLIYYNDRLDRYEPTERLSVSNIRDFKINSILF